MRLGQAKKKTKLHGEQRMMDGANSTGKCIRQ